MGCKKALVLGCSIFEGSTCRSCNLKKIYRWLLMELKLLNLEEYPPSNSPFPCAPFWFLYPISWEASPAGPAFSCLRQPTCTMLLPLGLKTKKRVILIHPVNIIFMARSNLLVPLERKKNFNFFLPKRD